uniref:Uncharacterized protein n=1 Tax=Vannella robusta TaxID=1487602 RepID=A0A7S4HQV4_9EUKA|mmetsp:Transcript_14411/g.18276  ORF Transcript_14411/g.18276 Transcript_14411/m.18276 type:complete len:244 (+) Transcript_14411:97-828(+)
MADHTGSSCFGDHDMEEAPNSCLCLSCSKGGCLCYVSRKHKDNKKFGNSFCLHWRFVVLTFGRSSWPCQSIWSVFLPLWLFFLLVFAFLDFLVLLLEIVPGALLWLTLTFLGPCFDCFCESTIGIRNFYLRALKQLNQCCSLFVLISCVYPLLQDCNSSIGDFIDNSCCVVGGQSCCSGLWNGFKRTCCFAALEPCCSDICARLPDEVKTTGGNNQSSILNNNAQEKYNNDILHMRRMGFFEH